MTRECPPLNFESLLQLYFQFPVCTHKKHMDHWLSEKPYHLLFKSCEFWAIISSDRLTCMTLPTCIVFSSWIVHELDDCLISWYWSWPFVWPHFMELTILKSLCVLFGFDPVYVYCLTVMNRMHIDPHHLSESPTLQKDLPYNMDPTEVCDLHTAITSQGHLLGGHAQEHVDFLVSTVDVHSNKGNQLGL